MRPNGMMHVADIKKAAWKLSGGFFEVKSAASRGFICASSYLNNSSYSLIILMMRLWIQVKPPA
jgi:hypothetical protein